MQQFGFKREVESVHAVFYSGKAVGGGAMSVAVIIDTLIYRIIATRISLWSSVHSGAQLRCFPCVCGSGGSHVHTAQCQHSRAQVTGSTSSQPRLFPHLSNFTRPSSHYSMAETGNISDVERGGTHI